MPAWSSITVMLFHILASGFAIYLAIEYSSLIAGVVVWVTLVAIRIAARVLVL
jgi:hypothetical protein